MFGWCLFLILGLLLGKGLCGSPRASSIATKVRGKLSQVESSFLERIPENQRASIRSKKQLTGIWEVKETGKKEPSWRKYSRILSTLKRGQIQRENRNFQAFDESGSFTNLSEYAGTNFFAYTKGSYSIEDFKKGQVAASVSKIIIVALGKEFEINVDGVGAIQVQYVDDSKRVFKSEENARVLQEKVDVHTLPEVYKEIFMVQDKISSRWTIEKINEVYKEYRGYAFFLLPVILYFVAELGVMIKAN